MVLRRCNMVKFDEITRYKRIVCYGIGNEFEQIIKSYSNYKWIKNVAYLIDGNPKRQGTLIELDGLQVEVVSLNTLKNENLSDIVILPTCAVFWEVVNMLNEIEWLNDVECYIFHCMFNLSENTINNIRQTDEKKIPATIHYCWFGNTDLPDTYKKYIDSWHKYCPDYSIVEWNEDNCNINETAFTYEAYSVGKFGFVPDYFRLKIIYENGGIYLDTDVELVKSLDDLRYNEAYCGTEFPGRINFGLGFGAVKNNSIIKRLMDYYLDVHFIDNNGEIDDTPSPVIQSRILDEMGLENGTHLRKIHGLTVYPVEVLSPKNPYTGEIIVTGNTYSIHHFDGTWLSDNMKSVRQMHMEEADKILAKIE